ncbi:MAG: outer membrane beta-barrel protein [Bacteroides sp.]|nr:outer membrane beta-barrel protein [Bacteroides sp.]
MKYLISILFFILPLCMWGAIIKGKVVDTYNEPVMFANIILLNDSVFIKGTTTDESGIFYIENNHNANTLKISIIGYDDYISPILDSGDMGIIVLQEAYTTLNEVVVKANLPQTQLKGNTMVTSVQNTVLAKIGNAYDVLSHIPMVTGINGELNVFGRGTPVVYINGREIRNQSDLQQLKSEEIRSVELISNPGAAYASNIAAVIKIKTIPPKGDGFGIDITDALGFWSYTRNNTDVNMRYRHNRFEVFGNFNIYEGKRKIKDISEMTTFGSDNFIQSIYNEGSGTTHNLFGKVGFSYLITPNHSIGAYYKFGRSKVEGEGNLDTKSIMTGNQNTYPMDHTIASYDDMTKNYPSQEANLYYNGSIDNLSMDFNADFLQSRSNSNDLQKEYQTGQDIHTSVIDATGLSTNRLIAEKFIVSYPVWEGELEVGEEYTNSRLSYNYDYTGTPIDNSLTDIHENNFAGFATLSQTFGKWNVALGLRYEFAKYRYFEGNILDESLSREYNNLFPSMSVSTKIGKVRLSLDFTNKMKRPSYHKLDGGTSYINKYVYQSGNPMLKPTKIYNVQTMGMWRYFYAVFMYNHDIDAVFNTTRNYGDDPLVKVLTFMNVPHYQNLQFTLGAQLTFGCWQPTPEVGVLKQFCSLEYKGKETSFNKPMYSFTLDNVFTLPNNWQIGADLWIYSAANSQNCYIKPTQQIRLSVRKSFFNDNLILQLKAVDILDRATDKVTIYSGDIQTYMYNHHEPRNITITVRYIFNKARSQYKGTGAGKTEKRRM